MNPVTDARDLLNQSIKLLPEIRDLYIRSLSNDELSLDLKLKLKNCLEYIRSSLDYIANHIFQTYCKPNYSPSKLREVENRIYFPMDKKQEQFEKNMNLKFKGLPSNLKTVLESYQPYNDNEWMNYLKKLTNQNKHIQLIKNNKSEYGTIQYLQTPGLTLENVSFKGCGRGIVINGQSINNYSVNKIPFINEFVGDVKVDYLFAETNTSIIETIEEIVSNSQKLINDLLIEL
ncbi:MAG: hypothetical protein Q3980_14820 [Turicibacter sp.]|nr:hypothetical protein [Turicibacter sp.]